MNAPSKGPMRIIGLAGWSGSGKTTLITKLIPCLIARGIKVSTLKHAHHGFDLDQPGKDSVEGFKRDAFPKLEIYRAANGKPLIHPDDPHIVAIASDVALPQVKFPTVDLNDIEAIADLLLRRAVPIGAVSATASVKGG